MPNFRRYYLPNAIIFITSVTRDRTPYLKSERDCSIFLETIKNVQQFHQFLILAYAIMPDHFHWLMRVDDQNDNFSKIIHSVKCNFTFNYKRTHNISKSDSLSIWQNRFWDHVIRDEQDLNRHFDYIHWNPVKHGMVLRPEDWKRSSYAFWYDRGEYPDKWGWNEEPGSIINMDFE